MKQVVVFPRGQLDPKDRKSLAEADIIAVEADDPSKIVTMLPVAGSSVSGDDIFRAAMQAIGRTQHSEPRQLFASAICAAVKPAIPK